MIISSHMAEKALYFASKKIWVGEGRERMAQEERARALERG